jgi:acyl carrier protein
MMSSPSVKTSLDTRILQIFSDVLGPDSGPISLDSTPETVSTWDSLQHLNLILAFEEEFGIQFMPEEIETLSSPGKCVEVVVEKLGGNKN